MASFFFFKEKLKKEEEREKKNSSNSYAMSDLPSNIGKNGCCSFVELRPSFFSFSISDETGSHRSSHAFVSVFFFTSFLGRLCKAHTCEIKYVCVSVRLPAFSSLLKYLLFLS